MSSAATLTAWTTRPLGECGQWISGGTPRTTEPSYWNGDIPWFSAKSLKTFDLADAEDRVTRIGAENGSTLVPPGTILLVVRGMSLANELRVGITSRESALNQDLRGVIVSKGVDARYLARFLKHGNAYLSLVDNASHGTKRLDSDRLKSLGVPLPPLPEQRRIADILDKADAICRKRREAAQMTRSLPMTTYREVFAGFLKPNAPCSSLSDVAEVVSGVAKGRKLGTSDVKLVPYLRVANVQAGRLDMSELKTIPATPVEIEALALQVGDVVMTEGGDFDKLGRGALWDQEISECIHQNHVFRVRAQRDKLLPVFFVYFLQTELAKAYFIRCAKKTTNLASINMTQLRALPVPLPPIALQEAFERDLQVAHHSTDLQRRSQESAEHLFESLVQRAFRGNL